MKIILTDKTEIVVNSIRPTADGLTIDVAAESLADIEQQITKESVDTITCVEGNTIFARYCDQQLINISKDNTGIHIITKYKVVTADKDVSKQLAELQNTILSMKNDLAEVQSVQDIQNVALVEIGGIVSQNVAADMDNENQEGEGQE